MRAQNAGGCATKSLKAVRRIAARETSWWNRFGIHMTYVTRMDFLSAAQPNRYTKTSLKVFQQESDQVCSWYRWLTDRIYRSDAKQQAATSDVELSLRWCMRPVVSKKRFRIQPLDTIPLILVFWLHLVFERLDELFDVIRWDRRIDMSVPGRWGVPEEKHLEAVEDCHDPTDDEHDDAADEPEHTADQIEDRTDEARTVPNDEDQDP